MVHFCIRPSLISFIVLVFLSSFAVSSHANKVVEIGVICNHTDGLRVTREFCLKLLNSIPLEPGTDLVTIAQYTTDILRNNVTNIISLLNDLIAESGSDPEEKHYLEVCLSCYNGDHGALHDIEVIQQGLKSGDYARMEKAKEGLFLSNIYCFEAQEPPKHQFLLEEYGQSLHLVSVVFQAEQYVLENC